MISFVVTHIWMLCIRTHKVHFLTVVSLWAITFWSVAHHRYSPWLAHFIPFCTWNLISLSFAWVAAKWRIKIQLYFFPRILISSFSDDLLFYGTAQTTSTEFNLQSDGKTNKLICLLTTVELNQIVRYVPSSRTPLVSRVASKCVTFRAWRVRYPKTESHKDSTLFLLVFHFL